MKKILSLALAAAFLAPLSFADVSIYGQIRFGLEYDHYNDDANGARNKFRPWDQGSRLGFKGSDQLDNGDSVIWQVENAMSSKNGDNKNMGGTVWGGRNTFIGLTGNWGTFRSGVYDSAYKTMLTSSKLSSLFDDYADTADYKGKGAAFAQLAQRYSTTVNYDSPVFNGLQVRGQWAIDGAQGGSNGDVYNLAALYNTGGLNRGGAYQYAKNRTFMNLYSMKSSATGGAPDNSSQVNALTDGANTQGLELVGSYSFSGATLGAGWEHIRSKETSRTASWNNYVVLGNYWFNPKLEAQGLYAYSRHMLSEDSQNGQQGSLGLVYYLSKRTRWYNYLVYLRNSGDTDIAHPYTFTNVSGSLAAAPGQTATGFVSGLRSDF
ncbi:putative porin [Silvimonas terrae]|uniref:Putative porin n=1 Tax=Silvimonas terrae TaxID=300266 RepID=A0A840RMU7_9NEIS|nr:porin [Silvimonas terrae]MBB5193596.1 putative porin [Silvimonas terrae]